MKDCLKCERVCNKDTEHEMVGIAVDPSMVELHRLEFNDEGELQLMWRHEGEREFMKRCMVILFPSYSS